MLLIIIVITKCTIILLVYYDQYDDMMTVLIVTGSIVASFNSLLFGILLSYILYQLVKMMSNCCNYCEQHNRTIPANRDQEEDIQPLINAND